MLFLKRGCSSYADIGDVIRKARLGDYVVKNVPSLKHFQYKDIGNQDYDTESLVSLSYSMRLLVRWTLNGSWYSSVFEKKIHVVWLLSLQVNIILIY